MAHDDMVLRESFTKVAMEPVWWLAGTGLILVISAVWMKVRCRVPVSVNCWFCNQNTRVVPALCNSWHCPHCEQYNGFDRDGGYNRILEEQHATNKKGHIYNVLRSPCNDIGIKNGLCDMCNLNQQLKVQQLAHFVPVREEDYDEEIEQYRELLEKSYHLCTKCEQVVEKTLKKQGSELNLPPDSNFKKNTPDKIVLRKDLRDPKQVIKRSLSAVSKFIAVWLAMISVCQNGEEGKMIPFDFYMWREGWTACQGILISQKLVRELSGLGFLSCYLSSTGDRRSGVEGILLILWLLLHCFSWSTWINLRSAASLTLLLFTFSSEFVVRIWDRKKRAKRWIGSKPEERVGESPCDLFQSGRASIYEPGKKKDVWEKPRRKMETGTEEGCPFEKCWEFQATDSKQIFKNDVRTDFDPFLTGEFPETRSSVFCEKINSDMINLNLGRTKEKSRRSTNFLFQTRHFADNKKDAFPLLKPARFFAGTPNFLSPSEYEESCSRSSTPSLYPGRKCERSDSKDCYRFTDRLPSRKISFPVQRADFLHRFDDYHANSLYPLSDSVYTCGMQANFSFPSRNYVCDTVCPAFANDRLRESVEPNPPQKKSRPSRKTVFYALSLLLNLITLFFSMYRLWPEFITYDFKLPNFNFYL